MQQGLSDATKYFGDEVFLRWVGRTIFGTPAEIFRGAAGGNTFAPHVTFNMQGLYAFNALCLALLGRNTWC